MSEKKLKPCPFCGGVELENDGHFVECSNCKATGPSCYPVPGESGDKWNARLAKQEEDAPKEEPLAVLAERKGTYKIEMGRGKGIAEARADGLHGYYIRLRGWDFGNLINSPTYAEAESKAREYLNSLPDKEAK